ncbi:MAG TPA: sugar ABC transporter permease [Candidatus Egerieimonas faecigallinarum]|nr:sugar ABC transporter permease [Candidatus Egerieimonas faecigallinarum]
MKKRGGIQKTSRKRNRALTCMALPGVLLLFTFAYIPIFGLVLAFKDFRYDLGFWGSEWVGLENFEFFFKSNSAWEVLRNTIGLNFLFIGGTLVVSVAIALMMNEVKSRGFTKVAQTIMFFPYFISWVVAGYLLYTFLHHDYGILNQILNFFGLESVAWYSRAEYWPVILMIMAIWKGAGYNSIVYYAALMGIDDNYYEAAALDGANRWQMIWKISLPMIRGVITIMTILAIGRIMYADYGMILSLTREQGALLSTTDVLDTYILRALRVTGDTGVSSAVSCFQAVVGFLLIMGSNMVARRIDEESALF